MESAKLSLPDEHGAPASPDESGPASPVSDSNPQDSLSGPTPSSQPIAVLLRERGVLRIAIIDDIYDFIPNRVSFGDEALSNFWEDVATDEDALRELESLLGTPVAGQREVTDEMLAAIWQHRTALSALSGYFESLANYLPSRDQELELFCRMLEENLQVDVRRLGESEHLDDHTVNVVFLDWRLGPETAGHAAVEASRKKAREIYDDWPEGTDKPLIILMSGNDVSPQRQDEFIQASGLLGGMFYFVPKSDLQSGHKAGILMGLLGLSWPTHHRIQAFQGALEHATAQAAAEFCQDTRRLRVEDYVYIQNLCLEKEGEPLGDYMLWLLAAHLAHRLHMQADLCQRRNELNKMDKNTFRSLPPRMTSPSSQLAEMYKNALFDDLVGEVGPHPRDARALPGIPLDRPHLQLGDLFLCENDWETIEEGIEVNLVQQARYQGVYLLINAACDLAFSPDDVDNRPFDADLPLVLVRGVLQPLREPLAASDSVKTELFTYNSETYRIIWKKRRFQSVLYKDFTNWQTDGIGDDSGNQYRRIARMRLPFVLEVQHQFTSNLARIGVPVAPPVCHTTSAQLLYKDSEGMPQVITEPRDGLVSLVAHRVVRERKVQYQLTREGLVFLYEEFKDLVTNPPDWISGKLNELSFFLRNFYHNLERLHEPFKADEKKWSIAPLGIVRNKAMDEQFPNKGPVLWLNIVDAPGVGGCLPEDSGEETIS